MLRFAPNLLHMFQEIPERDRVPAAAELGFDAVEWIFPYALKKEDVARICSDNGVTVSYGLVPADWPAGNYGWAGKPGRQADFRRAADTAVEYAKAAGWDTIQVGHGQIPDGEEHARCIDTLIENLAYICAQTRGEPFRIVIEPVTAFRFGRPFVLSTMAQARDVHARVGADNLRLVFDTYHLRLEEPGTLIRHLDENAHLIGYAQICNVLERTGPGTGELDLLWIAERIWDKRVTRWIGLEFGPALGMDTWEALMWASRYGYNVKPRSRTAFAGS